MASMTWAEFSPRAFCDGFTVDVTYRHPQAQLSLWTGYLSTDAGATYGAPFMLEPVNALGHRGMIDIGNGDSVTGILRYGAPIYIGVVRGWGTGAMPATWELVTDAVYAPIVPNMTDFAVDRWLNGSVSDEGEQVAASGTLNVANDGGYALIETARIYCHEGGAATDDDAYVDVDPAVLRAGISHDTSIIPGEFSKLKNWGFRLKYTAKPYYDAQEGMTVEYEVSTNIVRAFANVHLSGAMTDGHQVGGVAFGKFSSVRDGDVVGKFECSYPAYFDNGIFGADGNRIGETVLAVGQEIPIGKLIDADGTEKTIYRYTVTGLSAGTNSKTLELPFAVGRLINIYGSFTTSNGVVHPVNSYYTSSNYCYARLSDAQTLYYRASGTMTYGIVVIEYTE